MSRAGRSSVGAMLLGAALSLLTAAPLAVPASAARIFFCRGHKATIVGTKGNDVGNNKLGGTKHADVIVGRGGNDLILGRGGRDILCGNSGQDFIASGNGADRAFGGSAHDVLLGQDGRDILKGETGNDGLGGGRGRDVCSGGAGKDAAQKKTCEKIFSAKGV